MNGYSEEGFVEWAREELKKRPSRSEIIIMEDELGIPNIESIKIVDDKDAWAWYHELKSRLEQQQRRSA